MRKKESPYKRGTYSIDKSKHLDAVRRGKKPSFRWWGKFTLLRTRKSATTQAACEAYSSRLSGKARILWEEKDLFSV